MSESASRTGPIARPRLEVLYPSQRDVAQWESSHRRGELPSAWPYGLDGLADFAADVSARNLSASEPLPRRVLQRLSLHRLLGGAGAGRAQSHAASRDIALTWDENSAVRMVRESRGRDLYSGVIWLTDALERMEERRLRLLRDTLRRMRAVWVLSRAQVEPLTDFLGADGPEVGFIRFGIDHRFFPAADFPERPLIVSAGGDRDRDTATLFEAMRLVIEQRPDVEIVIQTRSELTPPSGVTTVPQLSHVELRELYSRAWVVAVATRPNLHASGMTVALEAMATGRPVVISDTPGMDDYVAVGTGARVPVGDGAAMAQAILKTLGSRSGAEHLGRSGRRAVEESMTTAHMAKGIADLIGVGDAPSSRPVDGASVLDQHR